jgi:pimeloyl-ACP methyl ester carboxylesterase
MSLAFTQSGHGPLHLVLLHGYCEGRWIWNNLQDHLSKTYTVTSFDLPGFGDSSGVFIPTSIEALAEMLWAACEKERIINPVLVGHSLGGYAALAMTESKTEQVSGLVLVHSTVYADSPEKKANRDRIIKLVSERGATAFLNTFSAGLFRFPESENALNFSRQISTTPAKSIMAYAQIMRDRPDRSAVWGDYKNPLLMIAGKYDSIIDLQTAQNIQSLNPTSQLIILENSAHMGMFEEPEATQLSIKSFLANLDS